MKIFTSLYNYLCLNKTTFKKIFLFVLISYLFTDFTFAAENTTEVDPVLSFFNGLLKISSVILGALTALSSVLLHPGWTSGSVIGLDVQLKTLWIFVSNIVYFVFAMLFIYIAVMNIIGKGGDYELKNALPRFIVGVLIVPFSWFIVQFVISLSGVLTVGVLSLPYDTFKDTVFKEALQTSFPSCKDGAITINSGNTDKEEESDGKSTSEKAKNDGSIMSCTKGEAQTKLEDVLDPAKSQNLFGILTIYTYGVMQIDQSGKLFGGDITVGGTIKTIFDAILKFGFDLIFIVAYCLLIIALILVLVVRGFWLWLFTMFSPAFGLLYFFKKNSSGMGDAKNFNFMQFVKLAMMPVYVAGALSFGLLFLFVAGKGLGGAENNSEFQIINSGSTIKIHNQEITFSGSLNKGTTPIPGFTGSIGTFILQLFGLTILWIAVIAGLKSSEITASVVSPFESLGKSVGGLVKNLPSYAPIIPTPGGAMSSSSLSAAASSFSGIVRDNYSTDSKGLGKSVAKGLGLIPDEDYQKIRGLMTKTYDDQTKINTGLQELLSGINREKFNQDSNYRAEIKKFMVEKMHITDQAGKQFDEQNTIDKFTTYIDKLVSSSNTNFTTDFAKTGATSFYNNYNGRTKINELIGSGNSGGGGGGGGNSNNSSTPEFNQSSIFKPINDRNFNNDPNLIIENRKDFITKLTGSQSKTTEESFRKDIKDTLINKFGIPDTELTEEVLKNKDELIKFLKNNKQWDIQ